MQGSLTDDGFLACIHNNRSKHCPYKQYVINCIVRECSHFYAKQPCLLLLDMEPGHQVNGSRDPVPCLIFITVNEISQKNDETSAT